MLPQWRGWEQSFEARFYLRFSNALCLRLALNDSREEIEASTARISELVRAIKEYTYMDQAHGAGG